MDNIGLVAITLTSVVMILAIIAITIASVALQKATSRNDLPEITRMRIDQTTPLRLNVDFFPSSNNTLIFQTMASINIPGDPEEVLVSFTGTLGVDYLEEDSTRASHIALTLSNSSTASPSSNVAIEILPDSTARSQRYRFSITDVLKNVSGKAFLKINLFQNVSQNFDQGNVSVYCRNGGVWLVEDVQTFDRQ